jgi:hypothetical protein
MVVKARVLLTPISTREKFGRTSPCFPLNQQQRTANWQHSHVEGGKKKHPHRSPRRQARAEVTANPPGRQARPEETDEWCKPPTARQETKQCVERAPRDVDWWNYLA